LAYHISWGNSCFAYRLSEASKRSDACSPCWNFHADTPANRYGYSHTQANGYSYTHANGYRHAKANCDCNAKANRDCDAKANCDCDAKANCDCNAKANRDFHAETDGDTNPRGQARQHQHPLVCSKRRQCHDWWLHHSRNRT
jgi:hypothetical protein